MIALPPLLPFRPRARSTIAAAGAIFVLAAALDIGGFLVSPSAQAGPVLRFLLPQPRALALPAIRAGAGTGADAPLVAIDAGHGGFDPGAGAPGASEKRIALAIAEATADRLLALGGVRVALVRAGDEFLPLAARPAIAEALGADLLISIHADSAVSPEVEGANVYILPPATASRTGSETAAILRDLRRRASLRGSARLAAAIEREATGAIPFHEPFRRQGRFAVLQSAQFPAVLVEAGYISNDADAARLRDPAGQQAIARVLADATVAFLLAPGEGALP